MDNGIIPYVPKPSPTVSKKINVPESGFYKDKFKYDVARDVYICPVGNELTFKDRAIHHGKTMKSASWRMEDMKRRIKLDKEKVKRRQWLTEHIFGTMKRNFNQGYFLMRGIDKVGISACLQHQKSNQHNRLS